MKKNTIITLMMFILYAFTANAQYYMTFISNNARISNCVFEGINNNVRLLYIVDGNNTYINNCRFTNNTIGQIVHIARTVQQKGTISIVNSTITGNSCNYIFNNLSGENLNCSNNIIWGNTISQKMIYNSWGTNIISNSCMQSVDSEGPGIVDYSSGNLIGTDPLFVDAAGGNYRLSKASPCISGGDNASVPAWHTKDLDGNPRIVYAVDMGAYESSYFSDGDGSETAPYKIHTVRELAGLADYVNSGNGYATMSKHYHLMNDIDLDSWCKANASTGGWKPIGKNMNGYKPEYMFMGNFHGNGKVIHNLSIKRTAENNSSDDQGLFGAVSGAVIDNLGLENTSVEGRWDVGSIASTVIGGRISGCYNKGTIKGNNKCVGGIASHLKGNSVISNCFFEGTITSSSESVGGIVGTVEETSVIENSYSNAQIEGTVNVGGIVGSIIGSSIKQCHSYGNINGLDKRAGGIGGYVENSFLTQSYSYANVSVKNNDVGGITGWGGMSTTVEECYSGGGISSISGSEVGGIVGYMEQGTVQNCVAVNTFIKGTGADVNRIAGGNSASFPSTFSNNYALSAIPVNNVAVSNSSHTSKQGADKTVGNLQILAFYCTAGNWKDNTWSFGVEQPWTIWDANSYPYFQSQNAPASGVSFGEYNKISFSLKEKPDSVVVYNHTSSLKMVAKPAAPGEHKIEFPQTFSTGDQVSATVYKNGKQYSYPAPAKFVFTTEDIVCKSGSLRYNGSPQSPVSSTKSGRALSSLQYKTKGAADATYTNNVPIDAGEYTLKAVVSQADPFYSALNKTLDFTISPYTMDLSNQLRVADKTYDGTLSASLALTAFSIDYLRETDSYGVSSSGISVQFTDASAGNGKDVSVTGAFSISGTSSNNYRVAPLPNPFTLKGNILKAPLTVTVQNDEVEAGFDPSTYNGNYQLTGFVNGESESVISTLPSIRISDEITSSTSSGIYTDKILAEGGAADNYRFEYVPGTLTITGTPTSIRNESVPKEILGIKVFDLYGRLITESKGKKAETGNLPAGVYILKIHTTQGIESVKITKNP